MADLKIWPLLKYQADWVADTAKVKVAEKGRRIGLSWAEAYDSVLHAVAGGGNIAYISYSKDMTAGFIGDCADWSRRMCGIEMDVVQELLPEVDKDILAYSINFPSGKKIEALSSAPRQLRSRGRPGDRVIIDEGAFVDDIDRLLQSAMAVRIWGGTIRIISTHNGELNPFNQLIKDITDGRQNYALHTIPFSAARRDGLYQRVLDVQRAAALAADPVADQSAFVWSLAGEAAWAEEIRAAYRYDWQADEELECIPSAGEGAWIGAEDYAACEHNDAGLAANYAGGACWIGYDVARRRDFAVLSVVEKVGDVYWMREMVAMKGQRFSMQLAEISRLVKKYRVMRVVVDQTGMGESVVEQVQDMFGASRVSGVQFSPDRRLSIASALRDAFAELRMRVPRDVALRADVRSVRRAPGVTSDRPRLIADGADSDGHADRFWSLALAVSEAASGTMIYELHRVPLHLPHRGRVHGRSLGWRARAGGL